MPRSLLVVLLASTPLILPPAALAHAAPAGATAYAGMRIGATAPASARAVIGAGLVLWPAGRFVIEVSNKGDQVRRSAAPLKLNLVIEPPVTDVAAPPVTLGPGDGVRDLDGPAHRAIRGTLRRTSA
ncbi:hypothetical protein [Nonomuraea fuscirosea]|uniref:hypothetical protein n=1 Tax=Nonomuraea fuscirosea TaxID=1291556 RepID=UPI00341C4FF8